MHFPSLHRELGPATVAAHVIAKARDCPEILAAAAYHNPFVPVFLQNGRTKISTVFHKALAGIKTLCQKKLMILAHQELELVEVLCAHHRSTHLSIMTDATLPAAVLARMRHNLPCQCRGEIIQIPYLPNSLQPSDAMILVVGARAGSGFVLLPEPTLTALEHLLKIFWGEVVLLDPVGYPIQARGGGWMTVQEKNFFTGVASPEGYTDLDDFTIRRAA
jgi:hypothetical protein